VYRYSSTTSSVRIAARRPSRLFTSTASSAAFMAVGAYPCTRADRQNPQVQGCERRSHHREDEPQRTRPAATTKYLPQISTSRTRTPVREQEGDCSYQLGHHHRLLDPGPDNCYCPPPPYLEHTIRRVYLIGNLCKHVALVKRQCP
jgi:hypothetical protein